MRVGWSEKPTLASDRANSLPPSICRLKPRELHCSSIRVYIPHPPPPAPKVANSFYNEDAYSIQGNMMAPLVINEDVLDLVLPAGDAAGRPEDTLSIQTLQSVLSDTAHPIGRITPEKAICLPTPAPQR